MTDISVLKKAHDAINNVVATFPSLYEATDGVAPKTVADQVNQAFGLKNIIAIAYVIEDRLYGTLVKSPIRQKNTVLN